MSIFIVFSLMIITMTYTLRAFKSAQPAYAFCTNSRGQLLPLNTSNYETSESYKRFNKLIINKLEPQNLDRFKFLSRP